MAAGMAISFVLFLFSFFFFYKRVLRWQRIMSCVMRDQTEDADCDLNECIYISNGDN